MENDLRLSVSKKKCFDQCKRQFEFSYIHKLPKKDRDYHIFGKFAHQVLQDFHQAYIDGSVAPYNKVMGIAFKAALVEYKDKMTKEMIDESFQLINQYLSIVSLDRKNKVSANVIAVEQPFNFDIAPNLILNGMIDRVQIDDDNVIHVCDYKTVKNKQYIKNDFFQLLTYAYVIMLENENIEKVRASYILLRHNFEYVTTEFNKDTILEIKQKYIKCAQDIISEKEYKPNPTRLCAYCDYLDLCPEGKGVNYNPSVHGEVSW
ncbi:MAG TPA: PD-(D/E)XK nuclease family protein [Cytophagaceae bacterium]|jgi:putative RecB family exonuclease|nr:PD-(D/E)XK nuclease family protein [Cytophagaceae bacterium]